MRGWVDGWMDILTYICMYDTEYGYMYLLEEDSTYTRGGSKYDPIVSLRGGLRLRLRRRNFSRWDIRVTCRIGSAGPDPNSLSKLDKGCGANGNWWALWLEWFRKYILLSGNILTSHCSTICTLTLTYLLSSCCSQARSPLLRGIEGVWLQLCTVLVHVLHQIISYHKHPLAAREKHHITSFWTESSGARSL